jgi:hypothetical protein
MPVHREGPGHTGLEGKGREAKAMRRIGVAIAAVLVVSPVAAQAQSAADDYSSDFTHLQPGKPRGSKPLSRERFDEAVGKLFAAGDSNGDGTITLDEFNTAVETARDRAIRSRFAAIDADRNQSLSLAEFAEWQRAMGSTVLADGPEAAGGILVAEEIRVGFGRGDDDEIAERLVRPLTATALVEANEDYDSGVSRAELVAWEGKVFAAADQNNDGFVVPAELADAPGN